MDPSPSSAVPGCFAMLKPEFRSSFEEHCTPLPFAKGNAQFFNPALFHAAASNATSDVERLAILSRSLTVRGSPSPSIQPCRQC
jgi:ectoine hydroxylase-related dioxygenase (phytanoyl-CoA dioxygenase family)